MNLVLIYGPPAAGKLTIATELANITGYTLFHNHLTRDLIHNLYPNEIKHDINRHHGLVGKLRCEIFKYCSEQETNLIFTFVYESPKKDGMIKDIIGSINKKKDRIMFVELVAPREILLGRVANESRNKYHKLIDKELYDSFLKTRNYASLPYEKILTIDTSKNNPAQSANQIIEYFKINL